MKSYIPLTLDDVHEALEEECPECGARPQEDCRGISGLVVNARISPKDSTTADWGFFVIHDARMPVIQPLKLVRSAAQQPRDESEPYDDGAER